MKFLVSWIRSIYKNIGINKIVKTQEDAVNRARNEAAPINAQWFGIET